MHLLMKFTMALYNDEIQKSVTNYNDTMIYKHLSKNHINISYHLMMEVHEYYNLVLLPDEYSMIEDHFG